MSKRKAAKTTEPAVVGGVVSRQRLEDMDLVLSSTLDEVRKVTSSPFVIPAKDLAPLLVGLPVPAFALEYLFGLTGLPLSLIYMIAGKRQSFKTGLSVEFIRWFQRSAGGGLYNDAEHKASPSFIQSLLRYCMTGVIFVRSNTLEESQRVLSRGITTIQKRCLGTKEKPGPGRKIPMCFVVDSAVAKASESTTDKVETDGAAGLVHPVDANKINNYLKIMPTWLEEWPFAVVFTNHLKPKEDDPDHTPGGAALGFHSSMVIGMEMKRKFAIGTRAGTAIRGRHVLIHTVKNSMAENERAIMGRVCWGYPIHDTGKVNENGKPIKTSRQETHWDWHWSTVQMLATQKQVAPTDLKEVVDLVIDSTSDVAPMAHCKRLGIKEPRPWREVGRAINANVELRKELRQLFGVINIKMFDPNVDYKTQFEMFSKAKTAKVKEVEGEMLDHGATLETTTES